MHRISSPRVALTILGLVLGCSRSEPSGAMRDGPPGDLLLSARQLYEAYGRDLRNHERGRLAGYYHWDEVLLIVAGHKQRVSRAALDSLYRFNWQGPAYFEWDSLGFDSLAPGLVLVTGGFRWLEPGATDTTRYIYLSVLAAVDSGLAIRVEHETPAPAEER